MKKKSIIFILMAFIVIWIPTTQINASYNYTPWLEPIESAHSMRLERIIDKNSIVDVDGNRPDIAFDGLRDTFVYEDYIFVSDIKNNVVYQLNRDFEYLGKFPEVDNPLFNLNKPQGIFVINDLLYIADTDNERIVAFNINTKSITKIIAKPNNDIFETVAFKPQRLVVDRVGRVMVIAENIYEGILEFDEKGQFTRFFGTNSVVLNFFESLVYNFSSKKQRDKMALKLQTPFTSIDIDEHGYLYTVSRNEAETPIKKLNFKGQDILIRNGNIQVVGDVKFPTWQDRVPLGPSSMVDIAANADNNRYTVLDSNRGRLFTYDIEGHLLYIFGGIGTQANDLQGPSSVTYMGEKVIVTDQISGSIFVYEPTDFGTLINDATHSYYDLDYKKSQDLWEKVIKLNSNYFLAYAGVGKSQLRNGEWELATKNLKIGHDYYNYSKAYEQYRNEKLSKFLPYILVVILAGSAVGIVMSIRTAIKREDGE